MLLFQKNGNLVVTEWSPAGQSNPLVSWGLHGFMARDARVVLELLEWTRNFNHKRATPFISWKVECGNFLEESLQSISGTPTPLFTIHL